MPRSSLPFGFDRRDHVWPAGRGTVVKSKDVGSPGELHYDRVLAAVYAVILGELSTQPPRLHAHHGIELGIEIIRAAENFRRNLIFLDRGSRMVQSVFRQIAEEFAQRFRAMQNLALGQFLDLCETLFALRQLCNSSYIGLTGV